MDGTIIYKKGPVAIPVLCEERGAQVPFVVSHLSRTRPSAAVTLYQAQVAQFKAQIALSQAGGSWWARDDLCGGQDTAEGRPAIMMKP
jgi:hypothetical protein